MDSSALAHRIFERPTSRALLALTILLAGLGAGSLAGVVQYESHRQCATTQHAWDAFQSLTKPVVVTSNQARGYSLTEVRAAQLALHVRNDTFNTARRLRGPRPTC